MTGCCALNCHNRSDRGVKLYRIPSGKNDQKRRKIWLAKIKRKDFDCVKNAYLCEAHFELGQFEKRIPGKLKPNAIPTIFSYFPQPEHRSLPKKRQQDSSHYSKVNDQPAKLTCSEHSYSMHSPMCVMEESEQDNARKISPRELPEKRWFPTNAFHRKLWVKAVRRKDWEPSRFSTLCSEHFTEDQFDRTSTCIIRLRENAVPCVFPTHEENEPLNKNIQTETSDVEEVKMEAAISRTSKIVRKKPKSRRKKNENNKVKVKSNHLCCSRSSSTVFTKETPCNDKQNLKFLNKVNESEAARAYSDNDYLSKHCSSDHKMKNLENELDEAKKCIARQKREILYLKRELSIYSAARAIEKCEHKAIRDGNIFNWLDLAV